MGRKTVEAVFENGAFRVLNPDAVSVRDGERVILTVEPELTPKQMLELGFSVFDGLPESDVNEIVQIALDRSNFMRPQIGEMTLHT